MCICLVPLLYIQKRGSHYSGQTQLKLLSKKVNNLGAHFSMNMC